MPVLSYHALHMCCKLLTKRALDYMITVTPCVGLTLAGCQVPIKPLYYSASLVGQEEKKI